MKFFSSSGKPGAVPFYAKAGWVAAWLLILIFLAMILRNCAGSIIYGKKTEAQAVEVCYRQGIIDGSTGRADGFSGETVENPVLRKAYNKGYREGLDRNNRPAAQKD